MRALSEKLLWLSAIALLGAGMFYWYTLIAEHARQGAPSAQKQTVTQKKALALIEQAQKNPEIITDLAGDLSDKLRDGASIVINDAEFLGQRQGGMWRVRADKAAQPEGEKLIYLKNLKAISSEEGRELVNLAAAGGFLDDRNDLLMLSEGFEGMVHGYQTRGREAEYDLSAQGIKGRVVAVFGNRGRLDANTFNANLKNEKAQFAGEVRMQLTLKEPGDKLEPEAVK